MAAGDALEEYVFALFEFVKQRDGIDYLSTAFSHSLVQKEPKKAKKHQRRDRKNLKQRSESNPPRTMEIYNIQEEDEGESGSSKSNSLATNAKIDSNPGSSGLKT